MDESLHELASGSLWARDWRLEGPPVLCWHMLGAQQSGERLYGLAERLAGEFGLRPIVVDGPGFGSSPPLPRERYRPSLLADLAAELADVLDLAQVDFLGASWGGTIGAFFAQRHRARLRRLVLLDVGYQDPLEPAPLGEWIELARGRDDDVPSELRGAILWGVAEEPPSARQLAGAGAPTLLLTAALPPSDREQHAAVARFRKEFPQAEVVAVPGAGHDLVGDAEAHVAGIVGPWLTAS